MAHYETYAEMLKSQASPNPKGIPLKPKAVEKALDEDAKNETTAVENVTGTDDFIDEFDGDDFVEEKETAKKTKKSTKKAEK